MRAHRIIITGDVLRPGQEGNIAFLWAALRDRVQGIFCQDVELVMARPLAWNDWRFAQMHSTERYGAAFGAADLVIGFELPAAARRAAKAWIDIRRHPLRFDSRQVAFSFRTSFPSVLRGGEFQTQPLKLSVPRVKITGGCGRDLAIMLQMESDASLLHGIELLRANDHAPRFARLAGDNAGVWIVPHPNEPVNSWVSAVQAAIPRAKLWPGTAYEAMSSMPWMHTVSSSTGFEASHFGCSPIFLHQPEAPSAPFDLVDVNLWRELAGKFQPHRERNLALSTS